MVYVRHSVVGTRIWSWLGTVGNSAGPTIGWQEWIFYLGMAGGSGGRHRFRVGIVIVGTVTRGWEGTIQIAEGTL